MSGDATHQKAVLGVLEPGVCLTTEQLASASGLTRKAVTQAVGKLVTRDLVERAERGCFQLTAAGLAARDGDMDLSSAPVLRHAIGRHDRRNTLHQRIWQAIRAAQKGTVADLAALAGKDEANPAAETRRYLALLASAGYVRRLPRKTGRWTRYVLVRNTGPEAPIVRRGRAMIFDPNTGDEVSCHG